VLDLKLLEILNASAGKENKKGKKAWSLKSNLLPSDGPAYNNNNTAKINVLQGQGIFGKRRALDP
jgi:hypothetical protein